MAISVAIPLIIKDVNLEFIIKLVALFSLSFLYLETTKKVNYTYVLILLLSILSDSLFVFEETFYYPALFLLIINRFLYIVIIRRSVLSKISPQFFFYALPFVLTFIMIYTLLYDYIVRIQISVLVMGILSIVLVFFTFLNLLNKNNKKARYFFLGTTLMPFADVLMAISSYIDEHLTYVIIYHFLYYIARYSIYKSMVLK